MTQKGYHMGNDSKALELLRASIEAMREQKPNDRSELDRRYAVAITEAEKLLAYYLYFVEAG